MQQIQSHPDVLQALERVLAGRKSAADEAEAVRLRAHREASAPRLNAIAPPAPADAQQYVCVQLACVKDNAASVKQMNGVLFTDEQTGETAKLDLIAGLPHFIPAKFLVNGWAQRECLSLERVGLLTIQTPDREGSFRVDDCQAYGRRVGLIATGNVSGTLDSAPPRVTYDELLRCAALVAPGAPQIAEALLKLARGSLVSLFLFLDGNVSGANRQVGFIG